MTQKNNTKERIIKAACELFWQNSYESISVDSICEASNTRKGSFYHFFPSKEACAQAALHSFADQFEHNFLAPAFNPETKPLERFERFIGLIVKSGLKIQKNKGFFCGCPIANLAQEMATQSEVLSYEVNTIFKNHIRYFESALGEAKRQGFIHVSHDEIPNVARSLYATFEGCLLLAKVENDPSRIEQSFLFAINSLTNPLAANTNVIPISAGKPRVA